MSNTFNALPRRADLGAARTLLAEQGLHILESDNDSSRVVARVKAIAVPNDLADVHRKQGSIAAALDRAPALATVVRRYRLGAAPLIRDARKSWRTGRAALVMAGQFDLMEEIAGPS